MKLNMSFVRLRQSSCWKKSCRDSSGGRVSLQGPSSWLPCSGSSLCCQTSTLLKGLWATHWISISSCCSAAVPDLWPPLRRNSAWQANIIITYPGFWLAQSLNRSLGCGKLASWWLVLFSALFPARWLMKKCSPELRSISREAEDGQGWWLRERVREREKSQPRSKLSPLSSVLLLLGACVLAVFPAAARCCLWGW